MPKRRQHTHVGPEFFTAAPVRVVTTRELPTDAATAFRCLADGDAWKQWLGIDVTWTSEPGPGATRTVISGGQQLDEHFFVWEPAERMAFRLDASSLPVTAFAEDYVLSSTGPSSCQLAWTVAVDGNPIVARAVAAALKLMAIRSLPKLANLLRDEPARWAA
ncbi:MAG: hypothetical protein ACI867_002023 [Glaciecola sp.]|jgi:uncharacterized protein YndB with AHSA1/START domain